MSSLFDFLTDIAINPKQQIAFAQQPIILTDMLGLSEIEQAVFESKSSNKIAALFADETTPLAEICNDPNPEDPFPDPDPEPEPSKED
ncbi:hypothetical protein I8751_09025 [Nostocaceae cyanobacterium CENA357]|uniref:Uncharacterized protein n=1 Tax=Atlanticothrix silvestris CENA357 TaxID=1725252 RepID=A0A8J7KYK3_9CYAN|nr:hypothetical protein [Atlanticothrix silvestris]MBH8552515.1 hypothetical protein [Atlanticothrix silvestris CENA357]